MNIWLRLILVATGIWMGFVSITYLREGKFVFDNAGRHQTTFAAGGLGIALILVLLAFLPPSDWTYKHSSTRRPWQKKR